MRAQFAVSAALIDLAVVTASAIVVGVVYHALFYNLSGMAEASIGFGLAMASLVVALNALREEYAMRNYLTFVGHLRSIFVVWNVTFGTALLFMFATKETAIVSRASAILFYLFGFGMLLLTRAALVSYVAKQAAAGRVTLLRVVLVGSEAELRAFTESYQPWTVGVNVVASSVLRGSDSLTESAAAPVRLPAQ